MSSSSFLLILLQFLAVQSWGKPVYLRPNWPVATENLSIEELNENIINEAESTWLKIKTKNGMFGWVLEENLINAIYFSKFLSIKSQEDLFLKPDFRSKPVRKIETDQIVELIDQRGLWVEIKIEGGGQFWVKEDQIEPYSKDPGLFYVTTHTQLKQKPLNNSIVLAKISSGQKLQIKSLIKNQWAQVIYKEKVGFVPLAHLKSRLNIAQKVRTSTGWVNNSASLFGQKIFELLVNPNWVGTGEFSIDLKMSPQSNSRTLATIKPWSDLTVFARKKIHWIQSHVNDHGEVWWQKEEHVIPMPKVKNLSNVRQIVRNPKSKIFFASANGLFKSLDGVEWEPVEEAANKSQAIGIARDGTLFVGEKLTLDHGKSFQPYIKWDNLVEQLTYIENIHPKYLSILKITPLQGSSQRLLLKLDVGEKKEIQVLTEDQGKNWRLAR